MDIILENKLRNCVCGNDSSRASGCWGLRVWLAALPLSSALPVRFLTKREQKLMQRRQHAEELLEWKRRLDAEEAEIRRMEKQALAAWDKELLKTKIAKKELGDQRTEPKGNGRWGK